MKLRLVLALPMLLGASMGAQELSLIPAYERPRLVKGAHVALCTKSPRFKPAEGLQPGSFRMLLAENRFPELDREGASLLTALGTKGSQQKLDLALVYVSQAEKVDAGGFTMVRLGEVVLEGKVTDPKGWVLATFIAHTTFGPGEGSWKPDRKVLEKVFAQITRELKLPAAK